MNAGLEHRARGLSASSETRQMMADWLRATSMRKPQRPDVRQMLLQRYPAGLFNEAELEALLSVLKDEGLSKDGRARQL
ncbi:hypothetical protein [Pseudomonas caspiana]|uniref:hypothetical protein n=1 Tax=Pseudomonas caspiana TaxID=1451454 RepID=UPI0032EEAB43